MSSTTHSVDGVHNDKNATQDNSKFDVLYKMDDLNRLVKEEVGEWTGSIIDKDQRTQEWTLDHLGNWNVGKLDLNADGDWNDTDEYNDDRTHNAVNELTGRDTDDNGTDDHTLVFDSVGNLTDDDESYEYTYDPFGRLRKIEDQGATKVLAEYVYNGLGFQISELADTDDDGDADSNDKWFHSAFDERWRALCVYRESDSSPKVEYIHHAAGSDGQGSSSYIDSILQRRKDTSTAWATEAGDGTYEEKMYYCQNWRHDVSALVDHRGYVFEWVVYSAYGVPIGLPAGDDDVSVATDSGDLTRIQDRIDKTTGWAYSPMADLDFDGDVDATDKTLATDFDGTQLGWNVQSSGETANRFGRSAYRALQHGIHLGRSRNLLTNLGRWTARDTLEYIDGANLYGFVRGNPQRYIDTFGTNSKCPADTDEVTQDVSCFGETWRLKIINATKPTGTDGDCCEETPCKWEGVVGLKIQLKDGNGYRGLKPNDPETGEKDRKRCKNWHGGNEQCRGGELEWCMTPGHCRKTKGSEEGFHVSASASCGNYDWRHFQVTVHRRLFNRDGDTLTESCTLSAYLFFLCGGCSATSATGANPPPGGPPSEEDQTSSSASRIWFPR